MKWLGRVARLLWTLVWLCLTLAFYGTPLLGVWLSSSLAVYLDGPTWLALAAGLLLFPVLPLLWEYRSWRRRRASSQQGERLLTFVDRVSLRTFVVSLTLVVTLLCLYPQMAFVSLSTRGDWMLDGVEGRHARTARFVLFRAADGLEWLYLASFENPYEKLVEEAVAEAEEADEVEAGGECRQWPWRSVGLHPVVSSIPASAEASIDSVARYIAQREKDPFLRVKALHDYVADRVAYDADAFHEGTYPPQDAEHVFRTRVGVCAGYAALMKALGDVIGEKVVVVLGHVSPRDNRSFEDQGHAWNAVKIEGTWYLMDVTWDSGVVSREEGFTKRYGTQYFLAPPRAMVCDHLPDDPRWQLLESPLSRGEFLRHPRLLPAFFAEELELVSPARSQTDVGSSVTIELKNPRARSLTFSLERRGGGKSTHCGVTSEIIVRKRLVFPARGRYRVSLFCEGRANRYDCVGMLDFVSR